MFDHIGIFVLIAGSYTPMACCVLRGCWRWGMLAMAWLLAAAGSAIFLVCGVLSMTRARFSTCCPAST